MQTTSDSLKCHLIRVARKIHDIVSDPNFKPRIEVYLRRTVEEIGVDKDGVPTGGAKWKDSIFEKPYILDIPEDDKLIQANQEAVDAIIHRYDWERTKAEQEVREFKSWILKKVIAKRFDSLVLDEGVSIFINDLNKTPVSAVVKVFLLGVTTRQPSILIGDNLKIRKVYEEDLTLEYNVSFPPPRQPIPHSIAEINMDVYDRMDLLEHQYAAERLVSVLMLFKPWPVYLTKYNIIFPTIKSLDTISNPSIPMLGVKGNIIEPSDEDCLKKLYQVLLPMLSRDIVYKSGRDPVSIAYKLYSDALTSKDGSDWKLATAVSGLDALFVEGPGVDQTYKLKNRAAKLLGLLGDLPEDVRKNVNASYKIRSSVFHGEKLDSKQIQSTAKYLPSICEYLRKSILLFLFLNKKEGLEKSSIIDSIDDSFIGATKSDKETLLDNVESLESKIGFSYEELGMKSQASLK